MSKQPMAVLITILTCAFLFSETAVAQKRNRKPPPTRKFDAPGSPAFQQLNPGVNPPVDVGGNFVIGPTYSPASERNAVEGVPQGKVQQFTMSSKDGKLLNPGIARQVFGTVDPKNPKTQIVETHEIDYKRQITVYIPAQYEPETAAPFMVKLTKDPDGRAAMGSSSGGSAALIMAWYRTDLYHRVLTTSGTFVNQQWPFDSQTPDGAWGFHHQLIAESPKKPIRIFISVGDRDLLNPNVMRDGMHDWVEANNRMAKVLNAKGYHYQYLFCQNAGHGIGNAKSQFLPHAIEWVWKGYETL